MPRAYAEPIALHVAPYHVGHTASMILGPQMFARRPEFTFNMEQVLVGSWERLTGPYCVVERLEVAGRAEAPELTLRGTLDGSALEPGLKGSYALRLSFRAEPYRVHVHGEMLEWGLSAPLIGYTPCLGSLEFSHENHPPFEMARKAFMFFEGKGFTWLSDAERTRSETHRDPPIDEGGPWIQLFTPREFAGTPLIARRTTLKEVASVPLAGWVANDDAYLVAVASPRAFQAGTRWGPCLHSDIVCDPARGERSFDQFIYATPVDLELLRRLFLEDFPTYDAASLALAPDALWPYNRGVLLDSFEGQELQAWRVSAGTWGAYRSERVWINGNAERVTYAEGFTQGRGTAQWLAGGAALWELPAGEQVAGLCGEVSLPACPEAHLTHLGLDAMARGGGDTELVVSAEDRAGPLAEGRYRLHPLCNRRLLLALPRQVAGESVHLMLSAGARAEPTRLVFDNLRGFEKGRRHA